MTRRRFLEHGVTSAAAAGLGTVAGSAGAALAQGAVPTGQATVLRVTGDAGPYAPVLGPVQRWLAEEVDRLSAGQCRIVAAGAGSTAEAVLQFEDPFTEPAPVGTRIASRPFAPDAVQMMAWVGADGAAAVEAAAGEGGPIALPLAIVGESLGLWSRRPLEGIADFSGLSVAGARSSVGFIERLGATVVPMTAVEAARALGEGRIDAVGSLGATLDSALGIAGSGAQRYAPGWFDTVAAAWLLIAPARWLAMPAQHRALLGAAARTVALRAFAHARAADRAAFAEGRLPQARPLPRSVIDGCYAAALAWSRVHDAPGPRAAVTAALAEAADWTGDHGNERAGESPYRRYLRGQPLA